MTARAGNGKRQECAAGRVNLFVNDIQQKLFFILLGGSLRSQHQESRGNHTLRGQIQIFCGGEQIARELLDDELIVRFVLVECAHHIVAIPVTVAVNHVVDARRVRIAHYVEPLPAPSLSILGRFQ